MGGIPKAVTKLTQEGELPQEVAEFPQNSEVLEGKPYLISFANYNKNMCEIKDLQSSPARKAISFLREVGTSIFSSKDFQKIGLEIKPVSDSNTYQPLFNRLPKDTELKEVKISGSGRLFYFDLEPERTLFVVAVRENHLDTDKVRR